MKRDSYYLLYTILIMLSFVVPTALVNAKTWYLNSMLANGALTSLPRYQVAVEANTKTVAESTDWRENKVEISTVIENLYDTEGSWLTETVLRGVTVRLRGHLLNYPKGKTVTVRAVPASGYQFVRWVGVPWAIEDTGTLYGFTDMSSFCATSSTECSFTVSVERSGLRAVFEAKPELVHGSCGSYAKTYTYTANGWGSGAYCATGTPSPASPLFPITPGTAVSWTCVGANGGTTKSCSAYHDLPVGGSCTTYNSLTSTGLGYSICTVSVTNGIASPNVVECSKNAAGTVICSPTGGPGVCGMSFLSANSMQATCSGDGSGGRCVPGSKVCRLTTRVPYVNNAQTNAYSIGCRTGYQTSVGSGNVTCSLYCKAGTRISSISVSSSGGAECLRTSSASSAVITCKDCAGKTNNLCIATARCQ